MENYKEKYEKALEKAKELMEKGYYVLMPELFPELKEKINNEKIKKALIKLIKDGKNGHSFIEIYGVAVDEIIEWIERQHDDNPDWSDKDEEIVNFFEGLLLNKAFLNYDVDEDGSLLGRFDIEADKWLKNLKDRCNSQSEQVWSEEDEEMFNDVRDNFEINKCQMSDTLIEHYDKWFEKIKSFKPRNRWKPNEEQMNALYKTINLSNFGLDNKRKKLLESIYEDLKKLKG